MAKSSMDENPKRFKQDAVDYEQVFTDGMKSVQNDQISADTFIGNLSLLFETIPMADCATLFNILFRNIDNLKSNKFFPSCKNLVLRMSNDLLKRVSYIFDRELSGQINCFLTSIMPFAEKSGVNLNGHYNQLVGIEAGDIAEEIVTDDSFQEQSTISNIIFTKTDSFSKFWDIKNHLKSPMALIDDPKEMSKFKEKVDSLLDTIFTNFKNYENWTSETILFPPSLKDKRLFSIAFENPTVQISFLLELFFCFEFLLSPVSKFKKKPVNSLLRDWARKRMFEISKYLMQFLPDFPSILSKACESEGKWSKWKNEGCPDLILSPYNFAAPKRLPTLGEMAEEGKSLYEASEPAESVNYQKHKEITESLDIKNFFSYAVGQLDPDEEVDEEFQALGSTDSPDQTLFVWKAMRLLIQKQCYFLTGSDLMDKPTKLTNIVSCSNSKYLPYYTRIILQKSYPEHKYLTIFLPKKVGSIKQLMETKRFVENIVEHSGAKNANALIELLEISSNNIKSLKKSKSEPSREDVVKFFFEELDPKASLDDVLSIFSNLKLKSVHDWLSKNFVNS